MVLVVKNRPASARGRLWFCVWMGKIPWRRKWHPSPVFLPVKFHGQRSLSGYSPWDCKESDMTENSTTHRFRISKIRCEVSGYPIPKFSDLVLLGFFGWFYVPHFLCSCWWRSLRSKDAVFYSTMLLLSLMFQKRLIAVLFVCSMLQWDPARPRSSKACSCHPVQAVVLHRLSRLWASWARLSCHTTCTCILP